MRSAGNVTSTAKSLALHPNSVRYRLGKVHELTGLDTADPATLYVVALQFAIRDAATGT